jgi:glycosyltransferase involved in cell wall biosynthesis
MNFYYWSPFISNVATVKAVLNSTISIKKFSKKINPTIINVIGEWNQYKEIIKNNNINIINFKYDKNSYQNLPRYGFIRSRFSYLLISFKSIVSLFNFLSNKEEDDYIILHLLTSLPLILILIFNFKCRFILRISGFPKLNFFRKTLWKLAKKKLYKISTPTIDTKKMLIKEKIFDKNMIKLVRDPIVDIIQLNSLKKEKIEEELINPYLVTIGRLTKQKNHKFLIKAFKVLKSKYHDLKLVILGDGELNLELKKTSQYLGLSEDILFLGYKKNVFKYLKNSIAFILTSEWEDPGFVLIESAASQTTIISSNCKNGPKEFLVNGEAGYLYEKGDFKSFYKKFDEFYIDYKSRNNGVINKKKLRALKEARNYTKFNHFREIVQLI